jgi:23S rRNA (adenine2503-C2)-methyltransferase
MNAQSSCSDASAPLLSSVLKKPCLIGLTLPELEALAEEWGQPRFRAKQLFHWLYVFCERSFEAMTDLAKPFRAFLEERYTVGTLHLAEKQVSQDGTVKYLFQLADGEVVESVLMYFQDRDTHSICLSTQVGCAINCAFCATAKLGLKRHLTVAEIVEQYLYVQKDSGEEIRNIVFMGQGEPLHNFENTLSAMKLLNTGAEVGMRRITVSTSGLVPEILKLAETQFPITLAVSLHAPNNALRQSFMPINKRYPLEQLIPALHTYFNQTHRRITIEYILIDRFNDQPEQAHELGRLLNGLRCNINLIPYNPISADLPDCPDFKRSKPQAIREFQEILFHEYGKKTTVRLERGVDIDAACGQLANRYQATTHTADSKAS